MKINIVMAIWNCPDFLLKRALSSIENQIYDRSIHNIQTILIIDDCKDYSWVLSLYNNIEIYNNPENWGQTRSLNRGLRKAIRSKSDYVFFMDQDDCLYSTTSLLSLINVAENTGADIITSKILHEFEPYQFRILLHDNLWDHGVLYSTKFLDDHGIIFPKNHHNRDIAFNFWCNSINEVHKVEIDEITYSYNYYSESINHRNNNEYKSNNAKYSVENFIETYDLMRVRPGCDYEKIGYYLKEWFVKYYLVLSRDEITMEKIDLWKSLPLFLEVFSSYLLRDGVFYYEDYKEIYDNLEWQNSKSKIPLFSMLDFVLLIQESYVPQIDE